MSGPTLMSGGAAPGTLVAMTTMTPPTDTPPPDGPPPPPPMGPPPGPGGPGAPFGPFGPGGPFGPFGPRPTRRLQRSRTDKVAGGVAGGLGEYFGLDPVLFRVLFAVAAFFGGFGLVAYGALWFLLPEAGDSQTSPVDRLGRWLSERHVPLWLAAVVAVAVFWILVGGFGGWAWHGFFFPGAAVVGVVLLVVAFSRRGATGGPPAAGAGSVPPGPSPYTTGPTDPTISLLKPGDEATPEQETQERPMDSWYREARERGRQRRRRARPLLLTTLAAFVVGLAIVIVVDAASGVALPVYGVVGGGIALLGLVVGVIARRPSFSLIWLVIPSVVWVAAFGGTHVSFRDGAGEVTYRPTSAAALQDDYRLAFGRATLDLRDVYANTAAAGGPSTVTLRVGAGVSRVIVPRDANVTVVGQVKFGTVLVDGADRSPDHRGWSGWRNRIRIASGGSDGPDLQVILQVTDGAAVVDHAA